MYKRLKLQFAMLSLLICFVFAEAMAQSPNNSVGVCKQSIGKDFPAALPSDDAKKILAAMDEQLDAEGFEIRSLLVLRDCELIYERHKKGLDREFNHSVYSVTKSVAATLVGIQLHSGRLKSLELPIAEIAKVPTWFGEERLSKARRISLKNVMQMSSGLAYNHNPTNNPIYRLDQNRFYTALSPEITSEPGSKFQYSDGDATITGASISAAEGMHLHDVAKQLLFEPLKFSNHDWMFLDSANQYPGGWGLRLRTMDMLKVGQLYIQRGQWNGQRLFAENFIDVAWAAGISKNYALHWWIGNTADSQGIPYFLANGFKGQRIYVFPSLGMVAAIASSLPGPEIRKVDSVLVGAISRFSGPAVADQPNLTLGSSASNSLARKYFDGSIRVNQWGQDFPAR